MVLTAFTFIVILGILVFIHEFGHYITARIIGVAVEEFGFGLPPRAWGKKIGETIYSINWLPIGGFVRLAGEDELPDSRSSKLNAQNSKRFFWARSKKERAAILLAGVTMNFLLAVGITTYLLTQGVFEPSGRVHVESVVRGSPAEKAGLRKDDIIRSVRDSGTSASPTRLTSPSQLIAFVKDHGGRMVTLEILRDGTELTVNLVPRTEFPKGEGPMGVAISDLELKRYPIGAAPGKALMINLSRAKDMGAGIVKTIGELVSGKSPTADVAGPIGIAQVTGQAVKFGWKAVLEFMSILSLNLAVLNILPIPALDGGRLLFVVAEKVLGRKIRPAFEKQTHQLGMIILLILVVLISINDILRLAGGG